MCNLGSMSQHRVSTGAAGEACPLCAEHLPIEFIAMIKDVDAEMTRVMSSAQFFETLALHR